MRKLFIVIFVAMILTTGCVSNSMNRIQTDQEDLSNRGLEISEKGHARYLATRTVVYTGFKPMIAKSEKYLIFLFDRTNPTVQGVPHYIVLRRSDNVIGYCWSGTDRWPAHNFGPFIKFDKQPKFELVRK